MDKKEDSNRPLPAEQVPEQKAVLAWISDPLVDGRGTERSMLLGRALTHRRARESDFVVISGGLTAKGQMDEREAAEASLARRPDQVLWVPGKSDVELPGGPRATCGLAIGLSADAPWPLKCECCDGRLVMLGLDLTSGQIEEDELERLDFELAACGDATRKVIVSSIDAFDAPLIVLGKKRKAEAQLAKDLKTICRDRKVDLFLYGGQKTFESRKIGDMKVLGHPSSTLGVGLSRQRFFTVLSIGLDSGQVEWTPVYYAPPARQRRFDESFDNAADIETAVSLVEHSAQSEANHAVFQNAMEQQAERLKQHDKLNQALDDQLFELLSRDLKKS